MKPSCDMELLLTAVLKGAHATRRGTSTRHVLSRQQFSGNSNATTRGAGSSSMCGGYDEHLAERAHSRYSYGLTVKLIVKRLGKERDWGKLLQAGLHRSRN